MKSFSGRRSDNTGIVDYVKKETARYGGFSIGSSPYGNDIMCVKRGDDGRGKKRIIVTAGIHARECYTSLVVLEQIKQHRDDKGGVVFFLPLVNPDGAHFFETGDDMGSEILSKFKDRHREWKANGDGVDLNCNFPARFGTGEQNVFEPSPHGFVGEYPLCAAESRALAEFTKRVMPDMTVSYHCMGGELYWEFFQTGERRLRDERYAASIANKIGVKKVDGDLNSAGGYKDWCVEELGIPAVTIELLDGGTHPFCASDFDEAAHINSDLPGFILNMLRENI